MGFNADLNPKNNKSMDLLDMLKMESYLGATKTGKKIAGSANMVKSSADDKGIEFRFNTNQNANKNTG